MTYTPVPPRIRVPPTQIAKDTFLIHQVQEALGQPLFIYLNSMVILGKEPVIIDAGTPANRTQWLDDVFSLVDRTTCGGSSYLTRTSITLAISTRCCRRVRTPNSSATGRWSNAIRTASIIRTSDVTAAGLGVMPPLGGGTTVTTWPARIDNFDRPPRLARFDRRVGPEGLVATRKFITLGDGPTVEHQAVVACPILQRLVRSTGVVLVLHRRVTSRSHRARPEPRVYGVRGPAVKYPASRSIGPSMSITCSRRKP
jgi:hypothetical protein